MKKALAIVGIVLLVVIIGVPLVTYATTLQPDQVESKEVVCPEDAPLLQSGQTVKILNWNVQYMASKNYVFFYDLPDNTGPDSSASLEHVHWTLDQVAELIRREQPDIIYLQEMAEDSYSSQYTPLKEELLKRIPDVYACHAEAFYWDAAFVPHPRIMSSADMSLVTISRYRMNEATRHQLPIKPGTWLEQQFNIKRALLETHHPVAGGNDFVALNTHLDAFAQGSNTMQLQVAKVKEIVDGIEEAGYPWVLAGDFNLLPPGVTGEMTAPEAVHKYQDESEIGALFASFKSTVPAEALQGANRSRYFTHFGNNPDISAPDRTIDYMFHSRSLRLSNYQVLSDQWTRSISDHLPMVGSFRLPQ